MKTSTLALYSILAVGIALAALPSFATNLGVGTCESGYTSFNTIQSAVNAVHMQAAP